MALLYLGIGRSVSIGPEVEHGPHRHSTLQITIALDRDFFCRIPRSPWRRTRGVAINADVLHQARDLHGSFLTIHLLPERWRTARRRDGFLGGEAIRYLDGVDLSATTAFFRGLRPTEVGCSRVFQEVERLIEKLTGLEGWTGEVDRRLLDILETIQRSLSAPIRSRELARQACLSEDRFLHLFKEQLGITLRHYVIYQRVMRATAEVLSGASVTRAAIDAGFSDSSHFSRKFTELSGFPPSRLKQARGSFGIHSCLSSRCVRPASAGPSDSACAECVLFRQQHSPIALFERI
jgi:AraC-like DNA-binding protein